MRGSTMGLVAAAIVAGLAGCSLPEVLPLAGGTTSGPSPYGPWYEQHWATNSVLLAAADKPDADWDQQDKAAAEGETTPVDQQLGAEATPEAAPEAVEHPVEANASDQEPEDFSNTSPYQFPASEYAPKPSVNAPVSPDASQPVPATPEEKILPPSGGPIRY